MLPDLRALLPRDVRFLFLNLFLGTVPMGYLQVVLPLYLNRVGLDPVVIGLLFTVSGLVSAALVAFSGVAADRFGRQRFLVWGTALPMLSYLVFAATSVPAWLVLASVLGGVGLANGAAGALTTASFDALLAEHTPPEARTRVFSWAQALWSVALGVGSLAAGLPGWLQAMLPALGELGADRLPFLLLVLLAATATLFTLPVRDQPRDAAPRLPAGARGWLPRRSGPAILRYTLAVGLLGFGLGVAVQLLPLWFKLRFGADEALLGPWYGVSQMLTLSLLLLAPWLERRLGGGRAVLLAQVVGGVCLALVAVAPSFELAAGLFLVRNLVTNLSWPLQQALLMGVVAPEERASATGIGFAVWGLTNALGPALGGALLQAGALAAPLLIAAAAYCLAGVVFGLGFSRRFVAASTPVEAGSGG